ncbi:6-hydroxymethylpterin diphosphokinase MptE-like protein [Sulfuricurvum sp.]|uniref:6-hydroxymethylpterin diphosphokinase MptE-like protein n=1 Tax=Sulfuricurvum sp. TaxID=2025608 RepID=UPI003BB14F41
MDDITLNALKTFQENLLYFEENHKPLYDKINLLNMLIEEGEYTERYALEYKEEGYFDILELSSNEFLYKENSLEHAKRALEHVDLKRTGAVFKAQKYIFATDEQAEAIDNSKLSFHNSLWATIKIINYVSAHATAETHMNRVHKIIFLGVGLGLHLQGIIKKLNPQVIFIKEKNLETFRLSLFVTNYKELAQYGFLYFSLTDDEMEERKNFLEFLDKGNNYNLHMKHIPFTLDYQMELQRLQTHVLSQSYINYGYSAMLLRFIDSPRYLAAGYSFLNINKFYTDNVFSDKPVLLLFSGPSTSKNLDWVIANRDRFILVSALSTCRLLHRVNITPDVVIHIDPGENTSLLFEGLDTDTYFKDTTILLASNVDEATLQKFNRSNVHFMEQGTLYKKGFGRFSAPSVGEYTYGIFLIFGAVNLFMLGIDLALDNETLQTHGDFHPFQTTGEYNDQSASLNPNTSITYVKGNLLDQVPTLSAYKISIEQAATFTKMLKHDYNHVYNLSNGAYLEGCDPLRFDEYDWDSFQPLDRENLPLQIGDFFREIGSDDFNEDDKGQIRHQIKEAKKLEKIIKQHQKKKFAHAEAYLNSLARLSWDLSDMEYKTNSDLAQVYYEYFPIIMSYIFDLFNTQELLSPNKHVTQIDALVVQQLLKMSNLYITRLESYLK